MYSGLTNEEQAGEGPASPPPLSATITGSAVSTIAGSVGRDVRRGRIHSAIGAGRISHRSGVHVVASNPGFNAVSPMTAMSAAASG